MKTKRTLFSMVVFLSVFWFSTVFDIENRLTSAKDNVTPVEVSLSSSLIGDEKKEARDIMAFSYDVSNVKTTEDGLYPTHEDTSNILTDSSNAYETTGSKSEEPKLAKRTTDEFSAASVTDSTSLMSASTTQIEASTAPVDSITELPDAAANVSDEEVEDKSTKEASKYSNIGISTANNFVNIRKKANTESDILGKLYRDSAVEILDSVGDWYYVESGSIKGYVNSDYIKTGIPEDELLDKYGVLRIAVDVDGLNVREKPDLESDKLTVIYQNEKYPVIDLQDEWIKVDITDDRVIGFVKSEHVELIVDFKKAVSKEEEQELLRLQEAERIKRETAVQYRDEVDHSNEELKLLACLVHAEAGNQSYEGKLAVANVVLNRVKSKKYPNSIKAVIYQPGQFSVAKSGSLAKQLANYGNYSSKSQQLTLKAAKAALAGANNIGNRLYFHTYKSAVRKGYDNKKNSVKLEDHLFW